MRPVTFGGSRVSYLVALDNNSYPKLVSDRVCGHSVSVSDIFRSF